MKANTWKVAVKDRTWDTSSLQPQRISTGAVPKNNTMALALAKAGLKGR